MWQRMRNMTWNRKKRKRFFLTTRYWSPVDVKHSKSEKRWHALGKTSKRRLFVAFTVRGNDSIISARAMNKKEKNFYEQKLYVVKQACEGKKTRLEQGQSGGFFRI